MNIYYIVSDVSSHISIIQNDKSPQDRECKDNKACIDWTEESKFLVRKVTNTEDSLKDKNKQLKALQKLYDEKMVQNK